MPFCVLTLTSRLNTPAHTPRMPSSELSRVRLRLGCPRVSRADSSQATAQKKTPLKVNQLTPAAPAAGPLCRHGVTQMHDRVTIPKLVVGKLPELKSPARDFRID